jgi:uncharacterized tellurite resistance protein B-like protein
MNTIIVDSKAVDLLIPFDNTQLSQETIELLSHLAKRKLNQADITPGVNFLAALATMTLGVMFADGTVTESEANLLEKTIEHLVPQKGDVSVLIQLIINGIRENPIYQNPSEWLKLTVPLSISEKTLLMSFSYEMSAVDGEITSSENDYLKASAKVLKIDPRYVEVLSAWHSGKGIHDIAAWNELQAFIHPSKFDYLDLRLVSLGTVEVLSELTGTKLSKSDINPILTFLSSLLIITWGVMLADGMQEEEERQLIGRTIKRLIPKNDPRIRYLMETLLQNISSSNIYKTPKDWLKLTASLSEPEKMLMISFCYEMSAIDGEISIEEIKYLKTVTNYLEIDKKYTNIFESIFSGQEVEDIDTFKELKSLIHPDKFQEMDEVFVDAASYIIDTLELLSI